MTRIQPTVLAVWLCVFGAVPAARAELFIVSNYDDAGPGSLRQAIIDSNATAGADVIEVRFVGSAPYVIRLVSQFLPPLRGPVVVRVEEPAAPNLEAGPASDGGRGGGRGRVRVSVVSGPDRPFVVLDGAGLVRPRTPADCPGATARYDTATNEWVYSDERGTGPNVRGYYGAGLAVHDGQDVEISGLEIRNFCIGIAAVRSRDVFIHDVRIVDSHGAAGVIFTGDDGSGGRTTASFNNWLLNSELLDNGDGFEFTRGTFDSLVQGTTIALTQPLPVNGNAVEFAQSGDGNALLDNTFSGYVSTAVTVGGNDHTVRSNVFIDNEGAAMRASGDNLLILGNRFSNNGGPALSIGGSGTRVLENVMTGNGEQGVVIAGRGVTVSRNSIYDNGRLGIDVAPTGGGGGGGGGGDGRIGEPQTAASTEHEVPAVPATPVLDSASAWTDEAITLQGSLSAEPNRRYAVELFASRNADRHPPAERGWGEGEKYVGTASAVTDATGSATFALMLRLDDLFGDGRSAAFFTATATDPAGSTSRFGRSLLLSRQSD